MRFSPKLVRGEKVNNDFSLNCKLSDSFLSCPLSSCSVRSQASPELPPVSGQLCPASLTGHGGKSQLDPTVSSACAT